MDKADKHSHKFIEEYEGFAAFGLDRETDEETVIYYLQKFSDDSLSEKCLPAIQEEQTHHKNWYDWSAPV